MEISNRHCGFPGIIPLAVRQNGRIFRSAAIIMALIFGAMEYGGKVMAQTVSISAAGTQISLNAADGRYQVNVASLHWAFVGVVCSALRDVQTESGRDRLGAFRQLVFQWRTQFHAMAGTLRLYRRSGILMAGITGASAKTIFPDFTSIPKKLHVLSYKNVVFSGPEFDAQANSMPWILFDRRANTAIISPASDFLISRMVGDAKTSIGCGINLRASARTAARKRWTILVVGHGIRRTEARWGQALDKKHSRPRPGNESNVILRDFGYWTDHGAVYYYNYLPKLGYAGTLEAVARQFKSHGVPLAYMELDSWWYRKSNRFVNGKILHAMAGKFPAGRWNVYGGTWQYRASHQLFPHGLAAFQKKLDVPLVCHGRWIDPQSPYHLKYRISGVAPIDPAWWKSTADYFAHSGVIGYEQDWLNYIYQYSPAMHVSPRIGDAFTGNMAVALANHGMSLIYCMPLPRFFLQSAVTPGLSMIRCGDDYFIQARWRDFMYTSSLARAMGLWPWTDTLMSKATGNILLSVLSAGPVGVGDRMGHESWSNIKKVIRSDGRIVKPDAPLLPTDKTIISDAEGLHRPLVARTYSNQGIKTTYLFIWRRKGDNPSLHITPAELGMPSSDSYIVYNYFTHVASGLDGSHALEVKLQPNQWQYDIIAPEVSDGLAVLGDLKQFVPMGKQRILTASANKTGVSLQIVFAQGEHIITISGWSKAALRAHSADGGISVRFDVKTGLYNVTLRLRPSVPVRRDFNKSVYIAKVLLSTRKTP